MVLDYEQSLFFLWSVEQNARHANGHARDGWREMGEARKNYSRNWECFDQSCVNRTESVHETLRLFPVDLSRLLYGICVNIFIMNRYISKSYTTSKNTIDRQHTEREQL